MNPSLDSLFQEKNKVIHIFGTPGTYKTTFLVHLIWNKLKQGVKQIYLVDVSGNFPYIKLEPIKDLLPKLIVFQPRSLREEVSILDDLEIKGVNNQIILLIHDIFHRINPEKKKDNHLMSYLIAMVHSLSKKIDFPVVLTNEGRSFENAIKPFKETIMLRYLDEHLLFEKPKNQDKICISRLVDSRYEFLTELPLTPSGLFLQFPTK